MGAAPATGWIPPNPSAPPPPPKALCQVRAHDRSPPPGPTAVQYRSVRNGTIPFLLHCGQAPNCWFRRFEFMRFLPPPPPTSCATTRNRGVFPRFSHSPSRLSIAHHRPRTVAPCFTAPHEWGCDLALCKGPVPQIQGRIAAAAHSTAQRSLGYFTLIRSAEGRNPLPLSPLPCTAAVTMALRPARPSPMPRMPTTNTAIMKSPRTTRTPTAMTTGEAMHGAPVTVLTPTPSSPSVFQCHGFGVSHWRSWTLHAATIHWSRGSLLLAPRTVQVPPPTTPELSNPLPTGAEVIAAEILSYIWATFRVTVRMPVVPRVPCARAASWVTGPPRRPQCGLLLRWSRCRLHISGP